MELGFIILRRVQCKITNKYWIECCVCLRKYYKDSKIMIIDDGSNYEFITDDVLENTIVIDSEYKGRGELLPYLYYLKNPIVEKVIIIHDSVFFQRYVEFKSENVMLWDFDSSVKNRSLDTFLISKLDNKQPLIDLYKKDEGSFCFGGMSIITIDFLRRIDSKYKLENLLPFVTCRDDRMSVERVLGLILRLEEEVVKPSWFNILLAYCEWGYLYVLKFNRKVAPIVPAYSYVFSPSAEL